jgi:quinol-cytochrome oxidoreductase complex cytochrome b subunit/coenzyme F420-reducing hydrogenase delta subunit/Fe-S-cluster-containing hydrogenase component 2
MAEGAADPTGRGGVAMTMLQVLLRRGFQHLEALLDRVFSAHWNPLYHLGALGFYFFWIAVVSGIYLYFLFDTSVIGAYTSIEKLTREQWYLGGVMRSLHRYASDGLVLMMLVHLAREFALDRFRGARWFTWVTGVPIIALVYGSGITGYFLIWDELAQYVAIATAEFFDWLPIFADPIARNFLTPKSIDDRFFTLLIFMHIFVPLFLLFVLWIHLLRVNRARINPPLGLAIGTLAMLVALSFVQPVMSHAQANLAKVPGALELDWFYLAFYPLFDRWGAAPLWTALAGAALLLMMLPWLPLRRRAKPAAVDLAHCNGCSWCVQDCPYGAVVLQPRTDGRLYAKEAAVKSSLCVSCGICVGSCPSATPFRQRLPVSTGIDLPDMPLADVKARMHTAAARLGGPRRVIVFGCRHAVPLRGLENENVAVIELACAAQLPPSFLDYALSRGLADGVVMTGCPPSNCHYRLGNHWTEQRLARARDPRLRARVPPERLAVVWAGGAEIARLRKEIRDFVRRLTALPPLVPTARPTHVFETAARPLAPTEAGDD